MPTATPSVAVVILNWNQPELTYAAVASVISQSASPNAIIVVDNGSDSEDRRRLVELIQNFQRPIVNLSPGEAWMGDTSRALLLVTVDDNRGYAGGNNLGLKLALNLGCEFALVLNNDAVLPPGGLGDLLASASTNPTAALVGCAIDDYAEGQVVSRYDGGKLRYWAGVYWLSRWHRRPGEVRVNFVPGCAMLIRMAVVSTVGLFDERYFLYTEDVDLSYRAASAGWALVVNTRVRVRHAVSSSTGRRSPDYYYYVTRNTLLFIRERLPLPAALSSTIAFVLGISARCVVWVALGDLSIPQACLRGMRDSINGKFGPRLAAAA